MQPPEAAQVLAPGRLEEGEDLRVVAPREREEQALAAGGDEPGVGDAAELGGAEAEVALELGLAAAEELEEAEEGRVGVELDAEGLDLPLRRVPPGVGGRLVPEGQEQVHEGGAVPGQQLLHGAERHVLPPHGRRPAAARQLLAQEGRLLERRPGHGHGRLEQQQVPVAPGVGPREGPGLAGGPAQGARRVHHRRGRRPEVPAQGRDVDARGAVVLPPRLGRRGDGPQEVGERLHLHHARERVGARARRRRGRPAPRRQRPHQRADRVERGPVKDPLGGHPRGVRPGAGHLGGALGQQLAEHPRRHVPEPGALRLEQRPERLVPRLAGGGHEPVRVDRRVGGADGAGGREDLVVAEEGLRDGGARGRFRGGARTRRIESEIAASLWTRWEPSTMHLRSRRCFVTLTSIWTSRLAVFFGSVFAMSPAMTRSRLLGEGSPRQPLAWRRS